MKLILLTILVGIAPSESSFIKSKVKNDRCEYRELKVQPFAAITDSSLRSFLLNKLGVIGNTDCVQSYQAKSNDDRSPFYVFRIDRQTKILRSLTVCGVHTVKDGDFMWTACDNAKFYNYLGKCENEIGPEARHPQAQPILSCNQSPTSAPQVNPPNKVVLPTPAPRNLTSQVFPSTTPPRAVANEKSTTRKGWLSRLNCFTCG